jgi:hypothetical protein
MEPEVNSARPEDRATGRKRQIESMRQIAHKLIDHLAAVVGYAELARQRRQMKLGVCEELAKIEVSAKRAITMARLTTEHLKHIEGETL